jgi:hypothetical protein
MSTPETHPIDIVSMRAIGYSADGKSLVLAFKSTYPPDRSYSVPIECMKTFIADLQRLGSSSGTAPTVPMEKTAERPVAANNGSSKAPKGLETSEKPVQTPNQVAARAPRSWMLGTGLPQHPVVLLVFDPKAPEQAAYVIGEDGARKMAAGLVEQAERIAQHRSGSMPTAASAPTKN